VSLHPLKIDITHEIHHLHPND